jgi:hypothetical protein
MMRGKWLRGGLALGAGFLLGLVVGLLLARRWEEEAVPQEVEEKAALEEMREAPAEEPPAKAAAPKPWVAAALTLGLGLVVLLAVAIACENTSWSISCRIHALGEATRGRIVSVRDTLATTGEAAKAVAVLDQALQPGKECDVLAYLKAAIDELDWQSAHLEADSSARQRVDEARSTLRGICVDLESTAYWRQTAQPTGWLFPLPTPAATPSW